MDYELKPLGCYEYVYTNYTLDEAFEKLNKAQNNKQPVICFAESYNEERKELILDYHGIKGVVKSGYISSNKTLKPQEIAGKTTKICVTKIFANKKDFEGERLSIEAEAYRQLQVLKKGDLVEGVVKKILRNIACAFIDLKEGYCAYVSLKNITTLPSSCCFIDEYIKENEKLTGKVCGISNDMNFYKTSTINLNFLSFEKSWEEECEKIKVGDIYKGNLKVDRINKNLYYLPISRQVYIKIISKININNPVDVKINKIDYENQELIGIIYDNNDDETFDDYYKDDENENGDNTTISYNIQTGSMFDINLKSNVSPFSMRKNEEKEYEKVNDSPVFRNIIEKRIKERVIDPDIHFKILNIICELRFCTSRQIMSYLYSHNNYFYIESQDKLNKKLETLAKNSLIEILRFKSELNSIPSQYRIYYICSNGRLYVDGV